MKEYYFHGSTRLIKNKLEPRPSKVIEGEEAVFATNKRWLALFFILDTTDFDFQVGYYGEPHIIEQYPGAIEEKMKNRSGYIYSVDPKLFHDDPRLGMQQHEFISDGPVSILKTKKIDDVYEELLKTEVNIITFEEKMDCILDLIKKKKSNKKQQGGNYQKRYRLVKKRV